MGTYAIDVCQSNGNLLASVGMDKNVKIFDKRESKIVQTFDAIHKGIIICLINYYNVLIDASRLDLWGEVESER